MKRALLFTLLLAVAFALGMLLIERHETPVLSVELPQELPALPEPEDSVVKLSYVELAASPHRSELPGATQVYGWLTRADDGRPVSGGTIRLRFQNYATAPGSAAEEHADALARAQNPTGSFRDVLVQEDGGWYVDLPGKCWILDADYTPPEEAEPRQTLIRTRVSINAPIERGALMLSFVASPGLEVRGLVLGSQGGQPIEGAEVVLMSISPDLVWATTDKDGRFEMHGIDPSELTPEDGMISFSVEELNHRSVERRIAWNPSDAGIPAFKVVLEPNSP